MTQIIKLTCPNCGHTEEKEVLPYLNRRQQPELYEQLMANQLFVHTCSSCGETFPFEYEFIYHDPEQALLIAVYPYSGSNLDEIKEDLEVIGDQMGDEINHYHLRVVPNFATMIEKITLFNAGLDDRLVEFVKFLTDGLFSKEQPTLKIQGRYYYEQDGKKHLLYLTDHGQFLVDYRQELEDFAKDKFKKVLEEDLQGQFQQINTSWANHMLS